MNEKQRLIRQLSVALPICKCAHELQLETIKWEDLLNKTYEKQVYKTPFITAVINGGAFFIKWWITMFIIAFILELFPIQMDNLFEFVCLLSIGVVIFTSLLIKKIKRDYYRKEIEKASERSRQYLEKYICQEVYCLPEEYYWDYEAMKYVHKVLVTDKANTLNAALNMYKRYLLEEERNL